MPLTAAQIQSLHDSPDPFPSLGDDSSSKPAAAATTKPMQKENVDLNSESAFPSLPTATPKQPSGAWAKPVIQRSIYQSTYTIPQSQLLNAISNQKSRQSPKTISELFKRVSSAFNVNVDSSTTSQTKQTTFFVKGQSQKSVNEAIAYLTSTLSTRITITVEIPNSSRALLIGPKGSTLKSITDSTKTRIQVPPKPASESLPKTSNSEDSDQDSEDDYSIPITIEGLEDSIQLAQEKVYDIISQVIKSYTKRFTSIPSSFYPLIALKSAQIEQQYAVTITIPSQARLRAIAHQAIGEESDINENERIKQSAIVIKGEKSAVKAAIQSVERVYNDCQRTTKTISIPIPKRQHRTLVGVIGDEILEKTQCIVELPAADDISETCTIRGPQLKLPAALQLVMEKASTLAVEIVDLLSVHRVKTDLNYGVNVLRYLLRGGKLNKIADAYPGAKIYPPRSAYIEKSQTVIIDIVSSDSSAAISAREQVEKLVFTIPPSAVTSVEIDHLLHRHLFGKQARQLEDTKKITLMFPHESEQHDEVGLIYTGASELGLDGKALDNKIGEIVQHGVNTVLDLAKAASNITIQIVKVDPKFHKSIVGPGGTTLNAIIGEDKLVDVQLGTSKPTNRNNSKKEINEDEISVRGQKEEVDRVVGELNRIADEAENHHIVYGHETEISINSQYVPHIVGKNGSSITKLRESLGVQIDITQRQPNDNLKKSPQKATIKLVGRKENVEEATRRLNGLVEQLADQTAEKLTIARQYHASLIGTGGKYATRLEDKHGVKITFPKSSNEEEPSDIVTVKGGKKGVAQAKAELLEALEFEKENNNTLNISIPSSSIARIVGKGGQQINEIKESSGAQIDFDRSTESQQKVTINLRGTKKAIQVAKSDILAIIDELNAQQIINITDIDGKYHKSIIGQGGSKLRELIEKAGGPADNQSQSGMVQFPKPNSESQTIVIKAEKSLAGAIETEIRGFVADLSDRKTYVISIPTALHGDLIGRGGTKLMAMQREYNVSIHFPGSRDYNNMDAPVNVDELAAVDPATIVKVTGKTTCVEAAIEDLKKKSTVVSKTINVPNKHYHSMSENGRFFRGLRSYGVTVDVSSPPAKTNSSGLPEPSDLTPPEPVSRVDVDEEDEIAHKWESYELQSGDDDSQSEWKINGKDDQSVNRAVKAIENALDRVKRSEYIGYLVLQNRSTFPRIVGSKGSGIERIKNDSGVQSLTVSKSELPLITFIGSKDAIEYAKESVLNIRPGNSY